MIIRVFFRLCWNINNILIRLSMQNLPFHLSFRSVIQSVREIGGQTLVAYFTYLKDKEVSYKRGS